MSIISASPRSLTTVFWRCSAPAEGRRSSPLEEPIPSSLQTRGSASLLVVIESAQITLPASSGALLPGWQQVLFAL